jgi:hypothetical protein
MSNSMTDSSYTLAPSSRGGRSLAARVLFWLVAIVLAGFALYSRRPDALRCPQFFGEAGPVWYQQAYDWGWLRALAHTDGGYFVTLPRLVAALSLLVPVAQAPTMFNLCSLAVEAAPALFMLSPRLRSLGDRPVRCCLAPLYIAMPNMAEIHGPIGLQWHLAMLAFLVLISEPPQSRPARVFDVTILVLCALTGPYCLLLLPSAVFITFARKNTWSYFRLGILGGGTFLQGFTLLLTGGQQRSHGQIGASFEGFCRIVAGQIVSPILEGQNRIAHWAHSAPGVLGATIAVTLLAASGAVYALRKGSLALSSFVTFASMILVSSLIFSLVPPGDPMWTQLAVPGAGARYWMIPELALIAVVVWMLGSDRPWAVRIIAAALACSMILGMAKHWRYSPLPDLDYASYAAKFEQLPPGASLTIPLNPPGWSMKLTKR